jgi:[acyl-carrier-protein] S-malonyltransferase
MLTADLAIERTLKPTGITPDMVAGHSLGEYAALMSSGILDMDGACELLLRVALKWVLLKLTTKASWQA